MGDSEFTVIQVPGRICLIGDKIDLMGYPVIAAAIDLLMTLKIRILSGETVKLISDNFGISVEHKIGDPWDREHPMKYWFAIIDRLKDRISGFEAIVSSNVPVGAGLSSSAAFSVILVKGLNSIFNLGLSVSEIAELAYNAEHDDLGIMCGRMDQYSIAFGGATFIETGESPKVTCLDLSELPLVIADSQEERHAKKILNSVKSRLKENDPIVHDAFNIIHSCVLKAKDALSIGDYRLLGELMNTQQEQENRIGAATSKLNTLCSAALKSGALGAKQMGAGGGGCMVAVCPGKQKEVAEALRAAGGKPWMIKIYSYSNC
jgi:mevalonate kinase